MQCLPLTTHALKGRKPENLVVSRHSQPSLVDACSNQQRPYLDSNRLISMPFCFISNKLSNKKAKYQYHPIHIMAQAGIDCRQRKVCAGLGYAVCKCLCSSQAPADVLLCASLQPFCHPEGLTHHQNPSRGLAPCFSVFFYGCSVSPPCTRTFGF